MKRWRHIWLQVLVSVGLLTATSGWSQQPSLRWLGTLGGNFSEAWGVSADGQVVIGYSGTPDGLLRAFRWTAGGGMQDLGTLPGYDYSVALSVSANGSTVIGFILGYNPDNDTVYQHAFRWTADGGMQNLGTLPYYDYSVALDVSADGLVVVGRAANALNGQQRAFRWTAETGMQNLGTLPGGRWSWANGVSANGSVIVGGAANADGWWRAFRWTEETGMQDLGTILENTWSEAFDVSVDGSVVVGRGAISFERPDELWHAFRWTAETGMQDLGTLGGPRSWAFAVSADGSIVVGGSTNQAEQWRAFRWTAQTGMEDLNITYASLLSPGSYLGAAYAVSPNGRYIVGWGRRADTEGRIAFLLDTGFPLPGDVNRDGCVEDSDLVSVLLKFGRSGYCNEDLNWNGVVDDADLLEVITNFGNGC